MVKVWYRKNCYDGFGAAWVANTWLRSQGIQAEFTAVAYGGPVPDYTKDDEIYILDFSFSQGTLLTIETCSRSVLVLDHHKTAQENLKGLSFAHFDMNRSGAGMTWDHFFPGMSRPNLITYIEDRDLWKFKHDESKQVHAYLCSIPMDFEVYSTLAPVLDFEPEKILPFGETLLKSKEREVAKVCENAWLVEGKHVVAVVNTSAHWSEVGNALLEKFPEADYAMSFTEFEDRTMYSLRSEGDFDVSAIAKDHGGGGHKNAAGYIVKRLFHEI